MPRCCLGVVVPRSRVLHCRTSSAHPPARLRFPECRARVAWRTAMTAEFDEEVVFENSPLYQYLQDLGHTDFEICPVVSQEEEECPAESGRPEQDVHATAKQGIYSRTADIWKRWSPFFSEKKKDEKVHLLDIGFRLDGLCTILQQEVLIQEDVELIELLDPGILSAGQTQKLQNGHLPTLRSIATPNICLLDRVSAACPYKAGQHASPHLLGLRKAVYRTVRTNFRVSRLATLYMLKHYPLNSEIDNATNYICVVPLKDLGLGLSEEQVDEEEAHNLTDGFSLPALKVLFQLWIGQSSEFFRRLALLLSPENECQDPPINPELLPHYIWSDVAQDLPHTQAACLAELKRSYEFYRYFETQHQSGAERSTKRKREAGGLNCLHGAVRSLQLHLKALLNEVIILEDELEKLACSKETQSVTTEASLVLEEKLKMIQPHVQASNTCWEEAMCQVERMVRKPPTKKDLANASCDNLHCPVAPCVPPALRIEDKDPIPEEQEFEAYVEDTAADHEFSKEEVYLFSPEERERQKREMEESKRVLQELKAVLGLKASEAERQKWKQLLFSDHAVMKPTQTEEPMDNFEPSPDTEDPDVCKTLDFHQEISRESNGTGHHPEEATSGESSDIPINANVEAETRTCCQLEEAGPASSEEELGPPRPAPRTVLPASIKERLARLHQSSDLNFASGLAAQVASRSLTFTFLQEQTFGDDWDIDEGQVDNGYNHGEEGGNEDTCSEHEE
ncbi:hypothetical protein FKM82_012557 [Ascaphus truei]